MKNILFIAPESFPVVTSEAICNSKVAYALACAGHKVDVYTCSDRFTYPKDMSVNDFLSTHPNLKIIPVKNAKRLVSRQYSFNRNISNLFFNLKILFKTGYLYNGISIPYVICNRILEDIQQKGCFPYDVLITRGFYTEYAGIFLKKKFGIKWIANWNDPYPDKRFPLPYGKGYNAKLPYFENRINIEVQKMADIHTFPSERLRNYMLKCFPLVSENRTFVIPHMAHSKLKSIIKKDNNVEKRFRLVHSGSVGKPRNPKPFINALSNVVRKHQLTPNEIVCDFIGNYDSNLKSIIDDYGLNGIVNLLPPMNYTECMELVSQYDICIIIEAVCEEGIYLPTKFVDALQLGLPVFCVSPSTGTLNDLVKKYENGYVCDNTSINSIENEIEKAYFDYCNGKLPVVSSNRMPEFFEDSIVQQFIVLFNEVRNHNNTQNS